MAENLLPSSSGNISSRSIPSLQSFANAFPDKVAFTEPVFSSVDNYFDNGGDMKIDYNVYKTASDIIGYNSSFHSENYENASNIDGNNIRTIIQSPRGHQNIESMENTTGDLNLRFLTHSDLIDLNFDEINNLLDPITTHNSYVNNSAEKDDVYLLQMFDPERNPTLNESGLEFKNENFNYSNSSLNENYMFGRDNIIKKMRLEGVCDNPLRSHFVSLGASQSAPCLNSSETEKKWLLIPVANRNVNSNLISNAKTIHVDTNLVDKINLSLGGHSGLILPLRDEGQYDNTPVQVKSPYKVVEKKRNISKKTLPKTTSSTVITERQVEISNTEHEQIIDRPELVKRETDGPATRTRKQVIEQKILDDLFEFEDSPMYEESLDTTNMSNVTSESANSDEISMRHIVKRQFSETDVIKTIIGVNLDDSNIRKDTGTKCPICKKEFKKLKLHKCKAGTKRKITDESGDISTSIPRKSTIVDQNGKGFPCDICNKSFAHEKTIVAHKKIHEKMRCQFCQAVMKSESVFKRHIVKCGKLPEIQQKLIDNYRKTKVHTKN